MTSATSARRRNLSPSLLLGAVLLYGLLLTATNLGYNSVFIDEAYHISIGHQLLRGEPCPTCAYTSGWAWLHPVIAAVADSAGGLHGARAANLLLGLLLTVVVHGTARSLFGRRVGLLAAALFLCSGQTLYLMKLATHDMTAAFLLGLSFFMFVKAEGAPSGRGANAWLLAGSAALFLASIAKYLIPVFVPPLLIYLFWRHGPRKILPWVILPLALLLAVYALAVLRPNWEELNNLIQSMRTHTREPMSHLFDWAIRWVALALLLAIFGVFHERHGRLALILILLSLPIIVLHLVVRAEQSVNKHALFSLVFLAPAAAAGVDQLGRLFSMRSSGSATRMFFTVAAVVVYAAYGFNNLRWLEHQYADVSPLIEFFAAEGHDGMTVATNGYDSVIYSYTLGPIFPRARFVHITDVVDSSGASTDAEVDFILCMDRYYGKHFPCGNYQEYIEGGFTLRQEFTISLSWGETDAKIFGRR